jgi:hypothetical protein
MGATPERGVPPRFVLDLHKVKYPVVKVWFVGAIQGTGWRQLETGLHNGDISQMWMYVFPPEIMVVSKTFGKIHIPAARIDNYKLGSITALKDIEGDE